MEFFENIPAIHQKLRAIQEVGLGYLTLGQPCTTLSGGESQRIKLSSELSKRDTGRTLYILCLLYTSILNMTSARTSR